MEKVSLKDDMKMEKQPTPIPSLSEENNDASGPVGMHDIGAALYVQEIDLSPEELQEEMIKVRKILDKRIMPVVCFLR